MDSDRMNNWLGFQTLWGILLSGSLLLIPAGCRTMAVSPDQASPTPGIQQTSPESPGQKGQRLPITAQALVRNHKIGLEVATTPEQQQIGLMFRTELAPDRGMLFPFDPPRPVSFWMKNTLIPLDMLFLYQGQVRAISSNVPPCKQVDCPSYGTNEMVDQVIELKSGRAAELGIKVGDRIQVKPWKG
jgi:uncharacterized protein